MKFANNLKKATKKFDHVINSSPLWSDTMHTAELINIDNDRIVDYCHRVQAESEGKIVSNIGGFQYHLNQGDLSECKEINQVTQQCTTIVNQIFEETFQVKLKREIYLSGAWINNNHYTTHNIKHNHPGATFVAVYYARTNGKQSNGALSFVNPQTFQAQATMIDLLEENDINRTFSMQQDYAPQQNFAVFFPPWIMHQVLPNLDGYERISIAMNFK
jgi:uncharacterized protein (TIGR02466 family)